MCADGRPDRGACHVDAVTNKPRQVRLATDRIYDIIRREDELDSLVELSGLL